MVSLSDYRLRAKEILSKSIFDYYDGGSWDEITLKRNSKIFEEFQLIPRVLRGTSQDVQLSTKILGITVDFPLIICPTAMQVKYRKFIPEQSIIFQTKSNRKFNFIHSSNIW